MKTEADVFALRVPQRMDGFLFEVLLNRLDPDKKMRILSLENEADRIRSLFSDLLIRSILMQRMGLDNGMISFDTNEYGKPYLKGWRQVHFNLSHAGIWVVAAIDSHPVGIDVERIEMIDLDISKDFFSEDEHNELMSRADKISYFFTLWTLKESYIKNLGKGLHFPLDSFSISVKDNDDVELKCSHGERIEGFSFTQYNIHQDYKMVLCASHNQVPQNVNFQNINQLVRRFVA